MKDVDLAWAAGVFEGEGTIRITTITPRNYGSLCCSVVNTDKEMVEFFLSRWGGRLRPATGLRDDQRPAWVWVVHARVAARFLDEIGPYFRTKRVREKCALGLTFQGQKRVGGQLNHSPAYRIRQVQLHQQMRQLNRRGIPKAVAR